MSISIHALREEGDVSTYADFDQAMAFLSTPSARRATKAIDDYTMQLIISIHALREEGDAVATLLRIAKAQFLSTPSARRATNAIIGKMEAAKFLSTPSARRATSTPTLRTGPI